MPCDTFFLRVSGEQRKYLAASWYVSSVTFLPPGTIIHEEVLTFGQSVSKATELFLRLVRALRDPVNRALARVSPGFSPVVLGYDTRQLPV